MTDSELRTGRPEQVPPRLTRWGWYAIGIDVALVGINLAIALVSGSLAVQAEVVHTGVDLVTAIAVLVGLALSTRKTKAFPYGLYKLENVISVVLAVMIFITAYEIATEVIFGTPQMETVSAWMLAAVLVAGVVALAFSCFELRAGRAANSPALVAAAKEYRTHVFTAGAVFAALLGQSLHVLIDRIAAGIIVVAIVATGWGLLSDGMRVLLDASLEPDVLLKIRQIVSADPAVTAVTEVTGRNAGRFRFVEVELELRVHGLEKAGVVTRRIEQQIHQAVENVDRVLIHAEPMERTYLRLAAPLAERAGTLSEHFGEAPYFGLVQVHLADGAFEERQVLDNPFVQEERAKGIKVAEWLVGHKADAVLVKENMQGKEPVYVFGDAGVDLEQTDATSLDEAVHGELAAEEVR